MNEENFKEEVYWSGIDSSYDTSDVTQSKEKCKTVSWNILNPVPATNNKIQAEKTSRLKGRVHTDSSAQGDLNLICHQ